MATRTIKNDCEKKITSILTPFIPCSAKLPIISFFSSYFFSKNSGMVALSFYMIAIILIIVSAIILKKINNKQSENSYISELPEYRIPRINQIVRDSLDRVLDFIKRAGSVIFVSSIIIWFLLSFSPNFKYGVEIEESILASVGQIFSWIFVPIVGENSWEIAISAIQGLIAKEQVVSSMSIIAGLETENITSNIFSNGSPFHFLTPTASYAFVYFNLFSAPCIGAITAMRTSLGNYKDTLKAVGFQIGLAYLISVFIYNFF